MTFITWACLRCVQELATILGPQNPTQRSCVVICEFVIQPVSSQWCLSLLLLLLKSSLALMTEYQSPPAADTVALLRSHGNCTIN